MNGSLSYYPAGSSHQIRAGFDHWWGRNQNIGGFHEAGGYQLIFDTIGGVPYTPVEIQVRNFPYDGRAGINTLGLYVTDTWRPIDRLTLNLGLRGEAQNAFVPEQVKVQGPFGGSGSFSRVDAGSWKTLAPRVGVAFDLFGSGSTVLKGTVGKYYLHTGAFSDFAQAYNQNFAEWIHYRWHDLNGDKDYQPGEVNLDTNGPDYLRHAQGAPSNIVNPDLKLKSQTEVTVSLEQDVGSGLSMRGVYVYKHLPEGSQTDFATINTLRPYSVWNQAFTRRDPGPDGVVNTADDGGLITVYDYDPVLRGAAFVKNMRVANDRTDTFNNYEISLNKRKSGKWFAMTSLVATKNHRWLSPVVQSPNDELFPLDETWDLAYRLAAGYDLPFEMTVSTLVQVYNGFALQRTNQFRAVGPDGGPRFPSSSVIELRMEPYGARRAPVRNVVNVRLSKSLRLASGGAFVFDVDLTNLLNGNAAWGSPTSGSGNGQIERSGPTFGYVTRIQQPRAVRLGVSFSF
ncbi:MAG: TonB-dependent receptor [Acidobacteria bacterium]|nr:TonB-dependent receptor [Acidobacteriota bacterium]